MIQVISKRRVRAGMLDDFLELAGRLVEATRSLDAGCVRYELLQEVDDPLAVAFYEEWEDREALNRHLEAPHFKTIAPGFAPLTEGPRDLSICRKAI